MSFDLQFLGGANTVTGSKYLVKFGEKRILIDCGLFQGLKSLRLKNWESLPIPAVQIDFVILTHAHIDHSGYIPRLIKEGFRGKIYSTAATRDLATILLPDAGRLMEEEAEMLNRKQKTKHKPALPLFTEKEARESLSYFESVELNTRLHLAPDLSFEFQYAGHILGAASVIMYVEESKIAFTGDLGRANDRIYFAPERLPAVDYLVIESTYGNHRHLPVDPIEELAEVVIENYERGGVILIPAFAVGRTQTLAYLLNLLRRQKRIPEFPMFIDSPMATDVSRLYCAHQELHKLSKADCNDFAQGIKYIQSVEDSKRLNSKGGPLLIISSSGMLTGGRILHHLKNRANNPKNTILLTGYQAAGTRGAALLNGAKELKIYGEYVPIRAKVVNLGNLSAHPDYFEMINWLQDSNISPRHVFITHGEPSAADEFRRRLEETFGWHCYIPSLEQTFRLLPENIEDLNKRYLAQAAADHDQHYDIDGVTYHQGEIITGSLH